jgi:hypothetical protein
MAWSNWAATILGRVLPGALLTILPSYYRIERTSCNDQHCDY